LKSKKPRVAPEAVGKSKKAGVIRQPFLFSTYLVSPNPYSGTFFSNFIFAASRNLSIPFRSNLFQAACKALRDTSSG
jgi:hypothetical protein